MTYQQPSHVYVSRAKCGCATGVCNDRGDRDTAKWVSDWIKRGEAIERMTFAKYRKTVDLTKECEHVKEVLG